MADFDSGFSNDMIAQSAVDDTNLEYQARARNQEYADIQIEEDISKSQEPQLVKTKLKRKKYGYSVQLAKKRKTMRERRGNEKGQMETSAKMGNFICVDFPKCLLLFRI